MLLQQLPLASGLSAKAVGESCAHGHTPVKSDANPFSSPMWTSVEGPIGVHLPAGIRYEK